MSETKYTNEELALRVINGDKEALHLLYDQNVGLITDKCKEAFGYCGSPADADFDDLNQEAALSFMMSAPKFNPDLGYKFTTFIGTCVFNHMIDYIVKEIKTSNTECRIATRTTTSYDHTPEARKNITENVLLQDYWQKRLHIFSISAEKAYFIDYFYETIKNALDLLSPRQQKLISYRFGLGGDEEYFFPHTIEETSEHYGITKRDVIELQKKTLRKMRRYCHKRLAYIVNDNKEKIDETVKVFSESYTDSIMPLPDVILNEEGELEMSDIDKIFESFEDDDFNRYDDGDD